MSSNLSGYIRGKHKRVHGWLEQRSAEVIGGLAQYQVVKELTGAVGEIGVHHGKLFILLALSATDQEKTFAIDVFEQQELNTDKSGMGERGVFTFNLSRNGIDPASVDIMQMSSLDLTGQALKERVGPIRMISIDGGHTEECVINDLAIADEALAEHGIVIMDDVFNSSWPAVVSGYARYLQADPHTVPFASSPNKVYACPAPFVEQYREYMRKAFAHYYDRSDTFFGFPIDSYGIWTKPSLRTRIVRKAERIIKNKLAA